jgi:hypothetical protein
MVIRPRASLSGSGYTNIDFPTLAVECRALLLEQCGLEQVTIAARGQRRPMADVVEGKRGAYQCSRLEWWMSSCSESGHWARRVKILRGVVSRAKAHPSRGRIRLSPVAQPHSDAPGLIFLDEDALRVRARTATCDRWTSSGPSCAARMLPWS